MLISPTPHREDVWLSQLSRTFLPNPPCRRFPQLVFLPNRLQPLFSTTSTLVLSSWKLLFLIYQTSSPDAGHRRHVFAPSLTLGRRFHECLLLYPVFLIICISKPSQISRYLNADIILVLFMHFLPFSLLLVYVFHVQSSGPPPGVETSRSRTCCRRQGNAFLAKVSSEAEAKKVDEKLCPSPT